MVLYNSANKVKRSALTKASTVQVARGVVDVRFASAVPFKVLIFTPINLGMTTGAKALRNRFNTQLREADLTIAALERERSAMAETLSAAQHTIAAKTITLNETKTTLKYAFPLALTVQARLYR
jgi:hypothetical protein